MDLQFLELRRCPSCRSESRRKKCKIKESTLYQCRDCRLKYLDPCLGPEAMKQIYESDQSLLEMHDFHEGYYDYGDLRTRSKTLKDFKRGLSLLEKRLSRKGKILDVGFGNGFFLAAAQEAGWEVRGIDPSAMNCETAKKKFGLDLERGSLEEFSPSELFDAISFWDVLEHLPDPSQVLQKARALLKPEGVLMIGIPNDRSLLTALASLLGRLGMRKPIRKIYFLEHVCYYSLPSLTFLLERNGFLLKDHFMTSTDLAKYKLSVHGGLAALAILMAGRVLWLQNRLVAVFQKSS